MNINQFERAVERQDSVTAKRCIDAAELMFRGMRDTAAGNGCDVGQCPAAPAPAPEIAAVELFENLGKAPAREEIPVPQEPGRTHREPEPRPAMPPPPIQEPRMWVSKGTHLEPTTAELETVMRRVLDEQRREFLPPPPAGWLAQVERRAWSFGVLARLVWAMVCCSAALSWHGVRRIFRGARRSR